MSVYSGYESGGIPMYQKFFMFLAMGTAAMILLSMLGTATVQTATPKPTPDSSETGIDFDDALAEAKSLLTDLKPGGELGYLSRSTSGYIRVGYSRGGTLFVTPGSPSNPALDAMAKRILAALIYP